MYAGIYTLQIDTKGSTLEIDTKGFKLVIDTKDYTQGYID